LDGCFGLSNSIAVTRLTGTDCPAEPCEAIAASISTTDPTTICADDGIANPINVDVTGGVGENSAWVVTDEAGNILALPSGSPIDLEGAGAGTCLIWYLTWDGDITGATVGANANDLDGCFGLSNSIAVTRLTGTDCDPVCEVSGATISTTDETTICADDGEDDLINVTAVGGSSMNAAWVITDEAGNILALPTAPPFNLEGAGTGTCLIWLVSFDELNGAAVGANANDLTGCFELSNSIAITRQTGDDCPQPTFGVMAEIFIDINADGDQDLGEGGLGGVVITVTDAAGNDYTGVTNGDGSVTITVPSEGDYSYSIGALGNFEFSDDSYDGTGSLFVSGPVTVINDGVGGQDVGVVTTIEACATFVTEGFSVCTPDKTAYNVLMVFEGGDAGSNGYTVINDVTGVPQIVTESNIVFGPFPDGTGFSFTVFPTNHPECSVNVAQTFVDCFTTSIELLNFYGEATERGNEIFWTTGSEIDNDFFTLERSFDGLNFEAIAKINSQGNNNAEQFYEFNDEDAAAGASFYRLSETDMDGTEKIASTVIVLNREKTGLFDVVIAPVPVETMMSADFRLDAESLVTIGVYNVSGQMMTELVLEGRLGENHIDLDVSNLAQGVYIFNIVSGDQMETIRFIKD